MNVLKCKKLITKYLTLKWNGNHSDDLLVITALDSMACIYLYKTRSNETKDVIKIASDSEGSGIEMARKEGDKGHMLTCRITSQNEVGIYISHLTKARAGLPVPTKVSHKHYE